MHQNLQVSLVKMPAKKRRCGTTVGDDDRGVMRGDMRGDVGGELLPAA